MAAEWRQDVLNRKILLEPELDQIAIISACVSKVYAEGCWVITFLFPAYGTALMGFGNSGIRVQFNSSLGPSLTSYNEEPGLKSIQKPGSWNYLLKTHMYMLCAYPQKRWVKYLHHPDDLIWLKTIWKS